ncbi:MAG: hypothetical protein WCT29_02780 [Candidatus Paceibacterota bacterium]|jgi:hypothetical protein
MHDEDENVTDDDTFEMTDDADIDLEAGIALEDEDSYDPDDRFH